MPYILMPPHKTGNTPRSFKMQNQHSGALWYLLTLFQAFWTVWKITHILQYFFSTSFRCKSDIEPEIKCISDVLFSVHGVNIFVYCLFWKQNRSHLHCIYSTKSCHALSSSHCSQPQHFKFVIVSAVGEFITDWMKFLFRTQHFYCFYLEVYSKSSECLLRDWNVKWKCFIFYVTYLCDLLIPNS